MPTSRFVALLTVLLLATAACSSSGHSNSASPAAGDATKTASAGAGPSGGGGGSDAKYCAAMKLPDAQALVKPPVAAAQTGGPLGCAFLLPGQDINGDNLTASVFPGDDSKQFYNSSLKDLGGTPTPLPGVGDEAQWGQIASAAAPEVVAHKGSLTCVVQGPTDTSTLTVAQTGNGPEYNISPSAAADYAAKMGVLCTDMFSVGS
jgi:hypothetical protein